MRSTRPVITYRFFIYTSILQTFEAGETIAKIEGTTNQVTKAYTSVQYGTKEHLELNSDLVYGMYLAQEDIGSFWDDDVLKLLANHSCEPNTVWDLSSTNPGEWHVRAVKRIEAGESSECPLSNPLPVEIITGF